MAKHSTVELYTTDFALDAQGAVYKGLIVVNKVDALSTLERNVEIQIFAP